MLDEGLESIINKSAAPQTLNGDLFEESFDGYASVKLLVPSSSVEAYKAADYWKKFSVIESDGSSGIADFDASAPIVVDSYGIDGVRSSVNSRGFHIDRMSDGTVRKVLVK